MIKLILLPLLFLCLACQTEIQNKIITVTGIIPAEEMGITLEHEHLLVKMSDNEEARLDQAVSDKKYDQLFLRLNELKKHGVKTFVECTPQNIGRNVKLLKKLSTESGINILTNTGLYGAFTNKYVSEHILQMPAEAIAIFWIAEFNQGIEGTGIKPGFIKIAVDRKPLSDFHATLAQAAAIAHKETGLTIMSHTGPAVGAFQQLEILVKEGVAPEAFIWTHACEEKNWDKIVEAAHLGCWISLDKYGWKPEQLNGDLLVHLKKEGVLDQVLISHDAGLFEMSESKPLSKSHTLIFETLIPNLKAKGLTDEDIQLLMVENPAKAFTLQKRLMP